MKRKISITLSAEVLAELDRQAGPGASRSAYIERVLRREFRRQARAAVRARDLRRLNRPANRLNAEAADVLAYQTRVNQHYGAR